MSEIVQEEKEVHLKVLGHDLDGSKDDFDDFLEKQGFEVWSHPYQSVAVGPFAGYNKVEVIYNGTALTNIVYFASFSIPINGTRENVIKAYDSIYSMLQKKYGAPTDTEQNRKKEPPTYLWQLENGCIVLFCFIDNDGDGGSIILSYTDKVNDERANIEREKLKEMKEQKAYDDI